jgi:hypothetical protein
MSTNEGIMMYRKIMLIALLGVVGCGSEAPPEVDPKIEADKKERTEQRNKLIESGQVPQTPPGNNP